MQSAAHPCSNRQLLWGNPEPTASMLEFRALLEHITPTYSPPLEGPFFAHCFSSFTTVNDSQTPSNSPQP